MRALAASILADSFAASAATSDDVAALLREESLAESSKPPESVGGGWEARLRARLAEGGGGAAMPPRVKWVDRLEALKGEEEVSANGKKLARLTRAPWFCPLLGWMEEPFKGVISA